jgi:predicted unusual protein kinase regulating ubiquinone biosynthesis (AarF/ABC1/UbiB family)
MSGTARLSRYRDLAWFAAKYGHADFLRRAGLEPLEPDDRAADDAVEAETFVADLEQLGPTFIKIGQMLSTRPDLLPRPYVDALARLQDEVEPFPYEEVDRILREELDVRPSKAFELFDPQPLAAASLGQVHRAVLRGGRVVAVKVQRPGIRERVLADLDSLSEMASLFDRFASSSQSFDAAGVVAECRRALLRELDYREEAENLLAMRRQLASFPRLCVPEPISDFTTSRVLTMEYVEGTKITAVSPVQWTEIDGAALAEELFAAYLQQVLVDGVFHADPHPGNVLLTSEHRIALLDLGMIGRLSSSTQEQLLKLLLAVSEGRGDDAAAAVLTLGERRENFDEPALRRSVIEIVGRYQHRRIKDLNVGRVVLEMSRTGAQCGLRMAPEFALLGKTLLNLDEIGRVLDPSFDVNAAMQRHGGELLRRRMLKSASPANVFTSILEVREFAERLPGRVNRILDALAGNDLRLQVEVIDQGSIIEGLQKVANRIALGLVLAALIVGAAMLTRVPTTFTILGYPGLAMLLFLAAAGGGTWMVWTILAGDVRRTKAR